MALCTYPTSVCFTTVPIPLSMMSDRGDPLISNFITLHILFLEITRNTPDSMGTSIFSTFRNLCIRRYIARGHTPGYYLLRCGVRCSPQNSKIEVIFQKVQKIILGILQLGAPHVTKQPVSCSRISARTLHISVERELLRRDGRLAVG